MSAREGRGGARAAGRTVDGRCQPWNTHDVRGLLEIWRNARDPPMVQEMQKMQAEAAKNEANNWGGGLASPSSNQMRMESRRRCAGAGVGCMAHACGLPPFIHPPGRLGLSSLPSASTALIPIHRNQNWQGSKHMDTVYRSK